jgi:hypothetical protein
MTWQALVVGALAMVVTAHGTRHGGKQQHALSPTVTVLGPRVMAYNTFADPCPNRLDALSDSPPRAFRNTSGWTHL